MKFLNIDAIHESGTLLYNKPVKENFKITTAPCPVFKDDTYIEFANYATDEEKFKFNFQKVEFYYEPSTDIETITKYPTASDFNTEDGIVVKVYKLIGIIGTNLFGEQNTESNISQLCLYRAFEITNADAEPDADKYKDGITYYLYSYYSKGNLDYSKRYYLGENIPSGKYEVSYSSLTLNDKAIKGEAVKVDPNDIEYPTKTDNDKKIILRTYPVFGHNRICASGKYYELKIYESDNECPIYLPMQEDTVAAGKSTNKLVVNVNYSDASVLIGDVGKYCHTINNLDSWSTQSYCMYNTIHGYTTDITNNPNLETIKYFPVTNNEEINDFILGGIKHEALKTGINNFENIVSVPNISDGYTVSKNDYVNVEEPEINSSTSSVILNKNELYKFTATLEITDSTLTKLLNSTASTNPIFDIKFVLKLSATKNKDIVKLIEFNNNCLQSNDGGSDSYTINIEKYFTAPILQATTSAKLVCSDIDYKYIDDSDTTAPVKTGTSSLNAGFTITYIKLYQLTPKNTTLAGTFYTKYAYNTDNTYIGQDTFTLYDNDIQDSEVYREWYYYLDGPKFENNYTNIKISPIITNGDVTFSKETPITPSSWTSPANQWEVNKKISSISKSFEASSATYTDPRVTLFNYTWSFTNNNSVISTDDYSTNNSTITISRNPHKEKHLIGGEITLNCIAKPDTTIYTDIPASITSEKATALITWKKINSGITITSDSTSNSIRDNATLYVGKTYTNTYTIKSIYPIKSVSETNSTPKKIKDTWNTNNTYTYELSFTPTSDNISTNYKYTVTATDDQNWTPGTPPLSFSGIKITKANLIVKTEVEEISYNLIKTDDKITDQDGNEVPNISLSFEAEFNPSLDTDEATITYQWQKSTDMSTWTNIQSATSSSYTINYSQNSSSTTYYRCVASSTYANSSLLSKIATVIIHEINTEVTTVGFGEPGMKYYIVPTTNIIYRNYNDIQTAIDAAADYATTDNPTEVWIKSGTYKPEASLTMKNNVAIYGGFAGTETSKDQRVSGNNTILDGEGKYRVFYHSYSSSNPLTNSAKLDNVTIQNGYASDGNDNSSLTPDYGAGMFNIYASPEITNCTFANNSASDDGGGMYNAWHSSPVLTNCTFTNNSADYGGGMYNRGDASPVLTNCTFSNNSASYGGGMYNIGLYTDIGSSTKPVLINCTFANNSASDDGGGMYNTYASPEITNCTFSSNISEAASSAEGNTGGGAICNDNSSPIINTCTFEYNTAANRGDGGAITNGNNSTLILTDCNFNKNTATDTGGAIANHQGSSLQLNYCTFTGNTAVSGGAIENWTYNSSETTLTANYCYFVENTTTGTTEADSSFGGAIMSKGQTENKITGCTFNGNTAMSGGAIYSCANTDAGATSDQYSKTTLTNCTFFKNEATIWAGGAVENAESKLKADYCTFTENICGPDGAGAAAIYDNEQKVSTVLKNCILWNNKSINKDGSTSYSHGYYPSNANVNKINRTYCVIQNSSNPGEGHIITTDPLLQPLSADNGGNVPTCAVSDGSSAIGAGIVIDDITTDARGYIRSTTAPTIGAYEYGGIQPS